MAGVVAIPVATALASTALGVFVIALVLSGRFAAVARDAFRQPLGKALLVFFAVILLGTLHGPADWHERWESVWSWRKLLYAFLLLGLFGPTVWKDRFARTVALAAVAGGIASYLAWLGMFPSRPNHEIGVLFQNHTTQGMFFAAGILFCAQISLAARGPWRWFLIAGAVLLATNILFVSPGRSAYLVLAAIPAVLGIQHLGMRRVPLVLAAVGVLCVATYGLSPLVRDRVDLAWEQTINADRSPILTSVGFRAVVYRNTLELIRDNPVIGYGTGSFKDVYSPHVARKYPDWRGEPTADPHNQYMLIAMETGLIGLAAFGAVLFLALRCVRRNTPHAWIAAGVLLGWMLSCLFNSHFRTFPESHLIALILGAMLAAPREPSV